MKHGVSHVKQAAVIEPASSAGYVRAENECEVQVECWVQSMSSQVHHGQTSRAVFHFIFQDFIHNEGGNMSKDI